MHASKEDWLGSYQERADKNYKEMAELYNEAMQLPYPNVALKTVRDHATETLSLSLVMGDKVSEVSVNLSKVPTTDIIHLNKKTGDILNARLLKATIQMSKLEESKTKTLNLLRKVRVENKALKAQINNLQNETMQIERPTHKGLLAHKLFNDKEKEIQTLKRKLKTLLPSSPR